MLLMQTGAEGHALHGGGSTRDGDEEASTMTLGGHMYLNSGGDRSNHIWATQLLLCVALLLLLLLHYMFPLPTSALTACAGAGKMWNTLLSVQYALTPVGPDDGGFVAVPGSHKVRRRWIKRSLLPRQQSRSTNTVSDKCTPAVDTPLTIQASYECPAAVRRLEPAHRDGLAHPVMAPGDCLLFTEALTRAFATLHWHLPRSQHWNREPARVYFLNPMVNAAITLPVVRILTDVNVGSDLRSLLCRH